jgi:hypothetical protein
MTTERHLRASNVLLPALAVAIAVAAGVGVSAHRLNEFLQAARIDLRENGVSIDLALTPGADIANAIVASIDRDGNGVVTADEQKAYAQDVLSGLTATLDGARLLLRQHDVSFPTVDELRGGTGTIRIQLDASHSTLRNGRHQLFFSNGHHAGQSAYLANALVPASSRVSVIGQRRTVDQRELTIDYSVGMAQAGFASGVLMVGLVAAVLMVRYARRDGNHS